MQILVRIGAVLLLLSIVDVIALLILALFTLVQSGAFPVDFMIRQSPWLFLLIGGALSKDLIILEKFNPMKITGTLFTMFYDSLLFFAIFNLIMLVASGMNTLLIIKTMVLFAVWVSGRK